MESNKKEFQCDAAQSSGPRDPLQVLAEDGSGLYATPAIAPPHECHALLHQWRLHRTYLRRTYYWQCDKCRKQKDVPKRGLWKLLLTIDEQ